MKRFLAPFVWLLPQVAFAQAGGSFEVSGYGIDVDVADVADNIVNVLQNNIIPVATAVFIIGAFLYVTGGEKEDRKNEGKAFMIGALIGVGVVAAARAILNLAVYFVYG